jgi:uncharacterized lipoprotein
MLPPLPRIAAVLALAISLSACSYIASLFPDKQKQYRYSSELPDLEIPPDLGIVKEKQPPSSAESAAKPEAGAESAPRPRKKRAAPRSAASTSTLAQGDAPLIEIEEAFAEAWNDVNRALGRMELEVTDQNRSDGLYYVFYGEGKKPQAESGLWADLKSVFKDDSSKAREYRIKLEEQGDFTHIYVLDTEGKALAEGQGLELLQRLHEKLQGLDQPDANDATSDEAPDRPAKQGQP